jgi:biopolymer transport protein ExbB
VTRSSHGAVLFDTFVAAFRNPRLLIVLAGLLLTVQLIQRPFLVLPAMAQASKDPALEDDEPGAMPLDPKAGPSTPRTSDAPAVKPWTWIDTLKAGGTIGAIIILLSFVAVGLVVEHSLSLRVSRIMPENVLTDLEQMIAQGRIQEGIDYCYDPRNASLATDVVLAGLERYKSSEFGFAEFKSACEEAGEEGTARLYRKIDILNLIGVIAPMLGLLGTVQGMIEAFNVIASSGGAAKPYMLADSISKALVTTFEGLVVAIPAMVAYSFFRSQIDHLISETGKRVERITSPLSRRK